MNFAGLEPAVASRQQAITSTRSAWRSQLIAPLVVLILAMLSTIAMTWLLYLDAERKDRERFQNHVERTRRDIAARFETYVAMLTGGAGLFAASDDVAATEFHDYVRRLNLPLRFPGVQGVGWSRRVGDQDRQEVYEAMQRQGFSEFEIWPAQHDGSERHSILYLEPLNRRNAAAIGYDMSSEQTRRAAMEHARDSGLASASGKVTLVQEIDEAKQAGFLVYVPVYRGGQIPPTLAVRRQKLTGFVYSPFRTDDLFRGLFGGETQPRLHLEVFDGTSTNDDALLHSSKAAVEEDSPYLSATERLVVAGRPWTVRFTTRPSFERSSGRETAQLAFFIGTAVSCVLTTVTWGQSRARAVADIHAADLRESREEVRTLLDRERLQAAQLRENDRRKDDFLAMLAHELRNPLAPISNALEILPHIRDEDERQRLQQMMSRQVAHLIRLIDDLLDVSRIGRGKIRLRFEKVNLADVLRNAREGVEPAVAKREQKILVSLPESPPVVEGDLSRLVQVVTNLLDNASKFSPEGSVIRVDARQSDANEAYPHGRVSISVSDSGIGIAQTDLDRIFEMFSQLESPEDSDGGGLGIGLALAKSLVIKHRGELVVHSEGLGCGTTFTITLPAAASSQPPTLTASPLEAARLHGHRVLVVDDVEASARTLALLLKNYGHDTREANNGEAALQTAAQFDPDIVICDIAMPGMDGYEVARRLHTPSPGRRRPLLVALTGYGQDEDRNRAFEAGFDHHFVKPANLVALRQLIDAEKRA